MQNMYIPTQKKSNGVTKTSALQIRHSNNNKPSNDEREKKREREVLEIHPHDRLHAASTNRAVCASNACRARPTEHVPAGN